MNDTSTKHETFHVVYCGQREVKRGAYYKLRLLSGPDQPCFDTDPGYFKMKGRRAFKVIGGIYMVQGKSDLSAVVMGGVNSPMYVGKISDGDTRRVWEGKHEQAITILAAQKMEKHEAQMSALADALAPVRTAYRKTNANGKRALLLHVLKIIQS